MARSPRARSDRGARAGYRSPVEAAEVDVGQPASRLLHCGQVDPVARTVDENVGSLEGGPSCAVLTPLTPLPGGATGIAPGRRGVEQRSATSRDSAESRTIAGAMVRPRQGPRRAPPRLALPALTAVAYLLPRLGQHRAQDGLDLLELLGVGDQRRRELDHRVAAVVGAADQARARRARRRGSRAAGPRTPRR